MGEFIFKVLVTTFVIWLVVKWDRRIRDKKGDRREIRYRD
jgi:hypothetical protein